MEPRRSVALVIPLYNEADVVPGLIDALDAFREDHAYVEQFILVDDGSTDRTAELIQTHTTGRPGYTLLSFSRNFGHQLAVTAGLSFVRSDAAVILDADLQDPLDVIPEMVDAWRSGYDVVYGVRRRRDGETWFKRATAAGFYRLFRAMTDIDLPVDTGDFRLVSRRVIDAYRLMEEQQPFVRGLISWLGFNQIGIPYDRAPRTVGETKYPLRKMVRLALNSFTSFSDKPLRLAVRFGLGISVGSAVLGVLWIVLAKFVFQTAITGWASLVVVIIFFGGVQLFFLGLVGTYLARVYEEVKARPRFVIRDRWHSDPSAPADVFFDSEGPSSERAP